MISSCEFNTRRGLKKTREIGVRGIWERPPWQIWESDWKDKGHKEIESHYKERKTKNYLRQEKKKNHTVKMCDHLRPERT